MKKKITALVPGFDYLIVDDKKNRIVAEFVGLTRHGTAILATKANTYSARGGIGPLIKQGRLQALPRQAKYAKGGKPMRIITESRKSQPFQVFLYKLLLILTASIVLGQALTIAVTTRELSQVRRELTQTRASVATYHKMIKTGRGK